VINDISDSAAMEDEGDDEEYDRLACTRCGGDGFCQGDDPFWEAWDEFGDVECPACGGSGDRNDQSVF
jgi:DnaJ-class molecular chaperone